MRIAIACPGPSLTRWSSFNEDILVGVNRAVIVHACDWWAALDWGGIERWSASVVGNPRLLTNQNSVDHFYKVNSEWKSRETLTTESLFGWCSPSSPRGALHQPIPWTLYSMTSAIMLGAYLGGTKINVYGADWSGSLDWDFTEAGENRTEARWEQERCLYNKIAAYLAERNVEVKRHGFA